MAPYSRSSLGLLATFAGAAWRYWLAIFPCVLWEARRWRRRAARIPDPVLRELALATQRSEQGNLEGAAAFAALVPRARRRPVVRALVAFQAAYDYVDTLVEQPAEDPVENGRDLHQALRVALDPGLPHHDYYAHHAHRDDGGYLRALVDRCREPLGTLPSRAAIADSTRRAADRMIDYQRLNHDDRARPALAAWAGEQAPAGADLRWWETSAAAASSLGVFALIAAAARPGLKTRDARALERAYFPWVGALHVLLDSLVDHEADVDEGNHSLVGHYASPREAGDRLGGIAAHAFRAVAELPNGMLHSLLVAAMASFYLASPEALRPPAREATQQVIETMGPLATPVLTVLRARQASAGDPFVT